MYFKFVYFIIKTFHDDLSSDLSLCEPFLLKPSTYVIHFHIFFDESNYSTDKCAELQCNIYTMNYP